ncbi:hypothetical protein O0L34_g19373 [Tuta absoluta]|nr:hypothetical protein O0L34_g19373 [Tuta absoluta]
MSKSTLDALEKVLVRLLEPLEKNISTINDRLDAIQAEIRNQNVQHCKIGGIPKTQSPPQQPYAKVAQNIKRLSNVSSASKKETDEKLNTRASVKDFATKKIIGYVEPPPRIPLQSQGGKGTKPAPTDNDKIQHDTTTAVATKTDDDKVSNNGDYQWKTVQGQRKQKRKPNRVVTVGEGQEDEVLKTVDKLKYIQTWSFHPNTSEENLKQYINKIHRSDDYVVEKRRINTDRHAAFIIGVPEKLYERFNSPAAWPQGVRFSDWFFRRHRAEWGAERTLHGSTPTAATAATQ